MLCTFVSSTRGSDLPGRLHDQRRPHDLRERLGDRQSPVLVGMERDAVVGRDHHGGVVEDVDRVEPVEDLTHQAIRVHGLQQVALPLQVGDPRHPAVAAVDREVGAVGGVGVGAAVGEVPPREVG